MMVRSQKKTVKSYDSYQEFLNNLLSIIQESSDSPDKYYRVEYQNYLVFQD